MAKACWNECVIQQPAKNHCFGNEGWASSAECSTIARFDLHWLHDGVTWGQTVSRPFWENWHALSSFAAINVDWSAPSMWTGQQLECPSKDGPPASAAG
jgi:hypothetical protein